MKVPEAENLADVEYGELIRKWASRLEPLARDLRDHSDAPAEARLVALQNLLAAVWNMQHWSIDYARVLVREIQKEMGN